MLAVFACGFAPPTSEPLHIPAHVLPRADSKRLPDVHAAIQGPVPTLHPDGLAATLQAVIDKHSSFWNTSISVAVHNASLELAVSSGLDDYATGAKLTPDHRVPMGSTTKLYTAVAVLRLAEQGALSLDEPVAPLLDRYLALPRDCGQSGAFCEQSCLPHAHCFFDPSGTGCAGLPAGLGDACLGYCGRYIGCAGGRPVTARLLWQNQTDIEKVTFRQLLGMTSGVMDYYYDKTNWLYYSVLGSTRDLEPLEYLSHMNHSFLFAPGTPNRAAYSTNGFSLVGLALAGLFNLSDWAALDQRQLAWGEKVFKDDATLFATRGTCLKYPMVAKQYASQPRPVPAGAPPAPPLPFFEISNHSCLNSWTGGNIAARPLDVARFTHAVFTQQLLSQASLLEMTSIHPITDGFGAGILGYGLGMEGLFINGAPLPIISCGLVNYGHSGLDYGSGGITNAYFPQLKLGVSIALTSAMTYGSTVCGKNCSLSYTTLPKLQEFVVNDLLATLSVAAGLPPKCTAPSYAPLPASQCQDAPSFGTINGKPVTCEQILLGASVSSHQPVATMCDAWLGRQTLAMVAAQLAKANQTYAPPAGYPAATLAIELCKGTCGAQGAGPCWLSGKPVPWCGAAGP